MHKIKIVYDPKDGVAIPDGKVKEFLMRLSMGHRPAGIIVSTENIIHGARQMVAENMGMEVEFVFEGKSYIPDQYGRIADWPDGFADHGCRVSERILTANEHMRKTREAEGKGVYDESE